MKFRAYQANSSGFITCSVIALLVTSVAGAPMQWVYEGVDPEKTAGGHSAALDVQDYAHIVYGRDALYYDWEDDTGWHSETADAAAAPDSISLVLDEFGSPHVVYVDLLTHHVKYAQRDAAGWSIETIGEDAYMIIHEGLAVLCLDADGRPHVGYSAGSPQNVMLKHLSKDAAGWQATTLGSWSPRYLRRFAIVVDNDGLPHLACLVDHNIVLHAWRNSTGWRSAEMDVPGSVDALEFDAAGRLHAAYQDDDDAGWEGVGYVLGTEDRFVTERVLELPLWGGYVRMDLAVNRAGIPHLVMSYQGLQHLQHWSKVGGAWQQTTVETGQTRPFALAIDPQDRPNVLYEAHLPDNTWVTRLAWQDTDGWHTEEEPLLRRYFNDQDLILMVTANSEPRVAYSRVWYDDAPGTVFDWRDGAGWHERTLAEPGVRVPQVRLALNANGNPHIAYGGTSDDMGVRYAWHDGSGWHTTVLEDSIRLSARKHSDLALDSEGRPHIAYLRPGSVPWQSGGLRYAVLRDGTWESEVVNTNPVDELAIALDGVGQPHILIRESDLLLHLWQEDGTWERESVATTAEYSGDPGSSGRAIFPGIAVGQTGDLHICYYDYDQSNALRYGHRTAQGWALTTVDDNGTDVGAFCSLDLDTDSRPHIAYAVVGGPYELRYARQDGAGWHVNTVDSETYNYSSFNDANAFLCLAPNGTPHITYVNMRFGASSEVFRLARLGDSGWELTDLEPGIVRSNSLVFDALGRPHLAYYNEHGRGNLSYLWPPTVFHQITWSPIVSPQNPGTPIPVTLTARNASGEIRTEFTGSATLSGSAPGPVPTNFVVGAGTNGWEYPFFAQYHDARTQVIYPAGDLGGSCTLTSLALEVTSPPGQALENWTIRLQHTGLDEYPTSPEWETDGWTVVYQGNEPAGAAGWRTFAFTAPFAYNGTDNLLVDFSFNNASYSTEGECRATVVGDIRSITGVSDSKDGDPLDWAGVSPLPVRSDHVPNLMLGSTVISPVPVSVSPTTVGPFVDGVWTGVVTVLEAASNVVLLVYDGAGHGGETPRFDVRAVAQPFMIVHDEHFGLANGTFGFNLQGQDGQVVVVEASTDLLGWLPLKTNTINSAPVYFSDPDTPTNPCRYYRLLQP